MNSLLSLSFYLFVRGAIFRALLFLMAEEKEEFLSLSDVISGKKWEEDLIKNLSSLTTTPNLDGDFGDGKKQFVGLEVTMERAQKDIVSLWELTLSFPNEIPLEVTGENIAEKVGKEFRTNIRDITLPPSEVAPKIQFPTNLREYSQRKEKEQEDKDYFNNHEPVKKKRQLIRQQLNQILKGFLNEVVSAMKNVNNEAKEVRVTLANED